MPHPTELPSQTLELAVAKRHAMMGRLRLANAWFANLQALALVHPVANATSGGNNDAHALVATKRLREGPEGPTARHAFGAQQTPKPSAWSTQ